MPTTGDPYLASSLVTLIRQLQVAYPSQAWQVSAQTGTIGDATHASEGSASDHNAWVQSPDGRHVVRALDVAANVPGCPPGEALFQMVNRMYAARDPRVYPNGYAIYNGRITDWDNPGGYHAQQGDPHLYHVHISVSQNPAGYNSTAPWPLGETTLGGGTEINQPSVEDLSIVDAATKTYLDNQFNGLRQASDAQHPYNFQTLLGKIESTFNQVNRQAAAILSAVSKVAVTSGDVDEQQLAQSIADSLDDDLAVKVADVLAARLKS